MTKFGQGIVLAMLLILGVGTQAHATTFGPSAYTSAASSPFASVSFSYFHLEDFDDHLLNTPGVSVSPGTAVTSANSGFNGSIIDQVGLNGGCPAGGLSVACDTLFFGSGATGLTFTFNAGTLGSLPTHAGIVWTDGDGTTSFAAYAPDGTTVVCSVGPVSIADGGQFFGTIVDDRFFGCSNAAGISKIFISNTSGGIEVDHLQYGREGATGVPEPASLVLVASGLVGLVFARRRQNL